MTTATLTTPSSLQLATDDALRGFAGLDVSALADELGTALDRAFWSFVFQAEVEDALDTAFFRATLALTPTLTGRAAAA